MSLPSPGIPLEDVVAGAEEGDVVALVAVDEVVAVAAEQGVGAVAAEDGVVAGAAVEGERDERGEIAADDESRSLPPPALRTSFSVVPISMLKGAGSRRSKRTRVPLAVMVKISSPLPPLTSAVSMPSPPSNRSVSSPGFQIMRSSPASPNTWSSPRSPPVAAERTSLPSPPSSVSLPKLPTIVSLPAPPSRVSWIAPAGSAEASMMSLPPRPLTTSESVASAVVDRDLGREAGHR